MPCCSTARAGKAISFPSTPGVSVRNIAAVGHSGVYFCYKSISTPKGECLDTWASRCGEVRAAGGALTGRCQWWATKTMTPLRRKFQRMKCSYQGLEHTQETWNFKRAFKNNTH